MRLSSTATKKTIRTWILINWMSIFFLCSINTIAIIENRQLYSITIVQHDFGCCCCRSELSTWSNSVDEQSQLIKWSYCLKLHIFAVYFIAIRSNFLFFFVPSFWSIHYNLSGWRFNVSLSNGYRLHWILLKGKIC